MKQITLTYLLYDIIFLHFQAVLLNYWSVSHLPQGRLALNASCLYKGGWDRCVICLSKG